jgi:hypothetical protein
MATQTLGLGSLGQVMAEHVLGEVKVPVRDIYLGVDARPVRAHGVEAIRASIVAHGFLQISKVMVYPVELPNGEKHYRLIEGAHRVTALKELLAANHPRVVGIWEEITVSAYKQFDRVTELLIANLANSEKEVVVTQSLYDHLHWLRELAHELGHDAVKPDGRMNLNAALFGRQLKAKGCTLAVPTIRVYCYVLSWLFPATLDLLRDANHDKDTVNACTKSFCYTKLCCGSGKHVCVVLRCCAAGRISSTDTQSERRV